MTPVAAALGLRLVTPPTATDKATIDAQIHHNENEIAVYNSQDATPDATAQVQAARAQWMPVATVTETLAPESDTFEAWQVHELLGIQAALAKARGA